MTLQLQTGSLSEKVAAKTPQGKDLDSCTSTELAQQPGHDKIKRNRPLSKQMDMRKVKPHKAVHIVDPA